MPKDKPDEKDMHCGHRMRVMESYSKIELDALSPHQVLEYILFFVYPRGDVNPIAHRLLDKYGTVQAVLDADPFELAKVYGVNTRSAQMINGFTKIFDYYTGSKLAKKICFKNPDDIYDFCEDLLRFCISETFYAIAVDASFHVITKRKIGVGSFNLVTIDPHEIVSFVNETKAANVIFTHNHPGGYCKPTQNDFDGTKIFEKLLGYMRSQLIDHVIIGDDGVYSIAYNKKVREFSDTDEIKEYIESLDTKE